MGLDITAFSNVHPVTDHAPLKEGAWCEESDHHMAYLPHDSLARSFRGLTERQCYDTSQSQGTGFRAGSYGGYNSWRNDLAQFALQVDAGVVWQDPLGYQDKPFFELINFSDCEGTIGPEAAADLLKDFYDHRERYAANHDEYDVAKYNHWLEACEYAAAGGLIVFH